MLSQEPNKSLGLLATAQLLDILQLFHITCQMGILY